MDNIELALKAKETGRLKFWTMVEYEITKLQAEAKEEPDKYLQGRFDKLVELRKRFDDAYWGLISIRPKDGLSIIEFQKQMNKLLKKKWFYKNYLIVYEQKSSKESEMGIGMHSHIMFKLNGIKHGKKQKSRIQCLNEIQDTIKTFKCDLYTEQSTDIRTAPNKDCEQIQNYLIGAKASEEKQKIQKIDTLWREKNSIENYYGKLFVDIEEVDEDIVD